MCSLRTHVVTVRTLYPRTRTRTATSGAAAAAATTATTAGKFHSTGSTNMEPTNRFHVSETMWWRPRARSAQGHATRPKFSANGWAWITDFALHRGTRPTLGAPRLTQRLLAVRAARAPHQAAGATWRRSNGRPLSAAMTQTPGRAPQASSACPLPAARCFQSNPVPHRRARDRAAARNRGDWRNVAEQNKEG